MVYSPEKIGERISTLRKERNLTQKQFSLKVAEASNWTLSPSVSAISLWERGLRNFDCYEMACIATALETSADYLLFEVETENLNFARETGLSKETIDYLQDDIIGPLLADYINRILKQGFSLLEEISHYLAGLDDEIYIKHPITKELELSTGDAKRIHEASIIDILREYRKELCGK